MAHPLSIELRRRSSSGLGFDLMLVTTLGRYMPHGRYQRHPASSSVTKAAISLQYSAVS